MTPDQLASARAAHWREDAQPILTLEDAKAWLERMQLCLYLPRKTHVLAPAPSFVGAVLGSSSATPLAEAIEQAYGFLARLVADGFVVPLNLFGVPGEQPDFLIVTSALPHLAALQADRNWKKPPARTGPGKVSPLAIEIWKLLEREGALTATEVRAQLGHELTEAAAIRGLSELWQNLRVAPLPQPNQGEGRAPAHWEILSVTHKREMAAGSTMSQSTALSVLVSDYVQSVLAATAEDVEAFLSPVASRSRLRDVLRGLGATRQLKTLSMDAQTFLFVEGSLPDMPEAPAETNAPDKPAFMGRSAYRERMLKKKDDEKTGGDTSPESVREDTSPRTYNDRRGGAAADRPGRPGFPGRSPVRDAGSRGDKPGRPARFGSGAPSRAGKRAPGIASGRAGETGALPPFRESSGAGGFERSGERRSERPAADRPRSDRPGSDRPGSDRPGFQRSGSGRPPSGKRPVGAKPFTPREGARPSFRDRPATGGDRPFRPRDAADRPAPSRSSAGREGTRPPFRGRPAAGGDRPFRPRPGADRPDRLRGEGRPSTPRPFSAREGAARPPFRGKPAGDRPFRPRPDGDRPRPDRERSERPRTDRGRPEGRERPSGGRPSFPRREGAARPSGRPPRPAGTFGRREASSAPARAASSRPASSRPSTGRPAPGRPGASRPFSPGRNPGGTGRPGGPRVGSGSSRAGGRNAGRPGFGGSRSSGPRAGGPRAGGPRAGGSRTGGPASGRPTSSGFKSGGPKSGGSKSGGSGPGGSKSGGSRPGFDRPGGFKPRASGSGGPRSTGGRAGSARPGGMRPPTRKPRKEEE